MNSDAKHAGLSAEEMEAFDEEEYVKGREDFVEDDKDSQSAAPEASSGDAEEGASDQTDAEKQQEAGPEDEVAAQDKAEPKGEAAVKEEAEAQVKAAIGDGAKGAPQTIIPVVDVPDISNYEKEKAALLEERKRLRSEYRDGSIDPAEYDEKLDAINDKLSELEIRRASAESATKLNEAVRLANYRLSIEKVKVEARGDGVDYDASPGLLAMWDTYVKLLAQDPEHGNKPAEWFLKKGHEMVLKELGREPKKAAAKEQPSVKEAVAKRAPNTTAVSIATVPAAGATKVDDEFANLDKLSGLALERALARMGEDAAERYLSGL